MRQLVLVLALVAVPARAQSPDALIERVLAAARPADTADSALGPLGEPVAARLGPAVTDSVRARFRADLRPDLLRAALPFLESPAAARLAERATQRPPADRLIGIAYGIGADRPKKGTLADSALVVRYVAATQRLDHIIAFTEAVVRDVALLYPAVLQSELQPGETLDSLARRSAAESRPLLQPVLIATARLQLVGLSPADLQDATAAEQTDALRYVRTVIADGTARALMPTILGMARAAVDVDTDFDGTTRDGTPLDGIGKPKPH